MNRADTEYRKDIIPRTEVLRMAREAGIDIDAWEPLYEGDSAGFRVCECTHEELERFAALVASAAQAKEREACAMECLKKANDWTRLGAWGSNNEFHECAEAIRARGFKR